MIVPSLIFACDNWRTWLSADDSCGPEAAGGAAGVVSTGVLGGGISYCPNAFVSWARIFAVEKAIKAAANAAPGLWKPVVFITSHHFLHAITPQPHSGCAACQGALNQAKACGREAGGPTRRAYSRMQFTACSGLSTIVTRSRSFFEMKLCSSCICTFAHFKRLLQ